MRPSIHKCKALIRNLDRGIGVSSVAIQGAFGAHSKKRTNEKSGGIMYAFGDTDKIHSKWRNEKILRMDRTCYKNL